MCDVEMPLSDFQVEEEMDVDKNGPPSSKQSRTDSPEPVPCEFPESVFVFLFKLFGEGIHNNEGLWMGDRVDIILTLSHFLR